MKKLTLTPSQSVALDQLILFAKGASGFALTTLEGYAGTGKTTLITHLLKTLQNAQEWPSCRIAIMAPTNKAVSVLQTRLGQMDDIEAGSLHSFLGLRLTEREDGSHQCTAEGRSTLHEFDLAIVDECSMVSEQLFTAIMHSRRSCRILFVGDPAQLPPVNDRNESPVFRLVENRIRLSEVVRQARDNPIIAASIQVRRAIEEMRRVSCHDIATAFGAPPTPAGFMSGGMPAIIETIISENLNGRDCRAIAWQNETVERINHETHRRIYPQCTTPFAIGETVIANREFRATPANQQTGRRVRIFNSEEMTVTDIIQEPHEQFANMDAWCVTFQRETGEIVSAFIPLDSAGHRREINTLWSQYRRLKSEQSRCNDRTAAREITEQAKGISDTAWKMSNAFAEVRHIYAITAHKSQGSTFDTSLVFWDDINRQREDFEFNRMLYVAMTRASTNMAIVTQ